jgi:hypothetical protein
MFESDAPSIIPMAPQVVAKVWLWRIPAKNAKNAKMFKLLKMLICQNDKMKNA